MTCLFLTEMVIQKEVSLKYCWPWLFDRHFDSAVEIILESEKKIPNPASSHSTLHLCEELVPNSGSLFGKNICYGKTCCFCGLKSLLELDRDGEFQSEPSPESHQPCTSIFPPPMSRLLPVTLASSQCCWGTSGSAGGHGTAPAPGGRPCGSSHRSGSSCAWRWSPPGGSPWPDSQAGGAWRRLGISLDMHPASPRTCRAMHQLGGESPVPRQAQRPPFPT
ncbi:PREDICTED: LOW QUALITY PROTEIN: putative uncharacterized protein FLJ25328 [Cercocebus atys]|uniref:LOW QUALITY PROTEIN: putative uncharacterized protein FLJ25328 n=1 Tax=Cercocebus atys TaxID=9531 RepID=UPI0005F509C3|nr:PREDICTED: LOW QUALITY PROTEIN: putative uncharacterized protein FLJ25328 [Cercocebus atys]